MSKKLKIFACNRDIDKYVSIKQNTITEILYKDTFNFFSLLSQYIGLASFVFDVTVIDTNYNFLDFLVDSNIPCNKDHITIVTSDKMQSMEDVVREAALNSMEILAITNIALLPTAGELKSNPKKFSRSEFSESIFGVYKWLHNVPIPWKIIGNISWSRVISNTKAVDSPGGLFRKTMIDIYKMETIEDTDKYRLISIHKGKPKDGIKTRLDKKSGFFLPYIEAAKKGKDVKKLFKNDMKRVLLKYMSYVKEPSFIDSIFNQFKFLCSNRK